MSIWSVLDQQVSVQHVGTGSEDEFGDPTEVVTGTDEYRGRLVPAGFRGQVASREVLVGRDTVLVELMLWLEPRAVISSRDRAVVDGETFEVMGDPMLYRRSHGSQVHHIEAAVRRVASG